MTKIPDKKLIDNEIIKDLNEAEDLENVLLYCKNPNKEVMIPIKITNIRDLINRLQSRLFKEQNKNSKLRNERNHLQAENERLKEILNTDFIIPLENDDTSSLVIVKIDSIKAEAYKECIDKVKEKSQVEIYCDNQLPEPITTYHITEDKLDNLLKELVGD